MAHLLKVLVNSWCRSYCNCNGMFYNCVSSGFYCALKSRLAERSAQTHEECSNVSILAVRVLFLKFPGKSRSELYDKYIK